MSDEVLDVLSGLEKVFTEENLILAAFPFHGLASVVENKTRLTAQLEVLLVRRQREQPDWLDQLELSVRRSLRSRIESLQEQSTLNELLLQRQIEYSSEMISVIADEAHKLANNRSTTYTSYGAVDCYDITTPLSIDART
jgi:hypothetical protein